MTNTTQAVRDLIEEWRERTHDNAAYHQSDVPVLLDDLEEVLPLDDNQSTRSTNTRLERTRSQREDVFDLAVQYKDAYADMRFMGKGPEENLAVQAAYYKGIVNTLFWLRGTQETSKLLDSNCVACYCPIGESADQ